MPKLISMAMKGGVSPPNFVRLKGAGPSPSPSLGGSAAAVSFGDAAAGLLSAHVHTDQAVTATITASAARLVNERRFTTAPRARGRERRGHGPERRSPP